MTSALQNEDEMTLIELESLMTIMTVQSRKQVLRDRLINRLTDEKGLSLSRTLRLETHLSR